MRKGSSSNDSSKQVEQQNGQEDDNNWMEVKTKRNKRNYRGGNGKSNRATNDQLDFQFDSEMESSNNPTTNTKQTQQPPLSSDNNM